MKNLYAVGLSLLVAGPVLAQAPAPPVPAPALPTSFRNGSYLATDTNEWQPAKLRYTEHELLVSDAEHKPKEPLVLAATQVRAFVVGRDTFDVLRGVALPAQQLPLAFARRLFRGGGFLVAEYVAYPTQPAAPLVYKLLCRSGAVAAVLPPLPVQFRLALAAVVRDYQPLAHQLELDPNVLPVQLPELLAAYGRWKQAQPLGVTSK